MSPTDLIELPPELLVLILSRLSTPRDLWSFVRSSKQLYQTFRRCQFETLCAVIENAMLDDNMKTAIMACKTGAASVFPGSWSEVCDADIYDQACNVDFLQDRTLLAQLYRLWWATDYFMTRFEDDAFNFAAHKIPLIDKEMIHQPTRFERSRLQRSFLRFEIYRRIPLMGDECLQRCHCIARPLHDRHMASRFLHQFPPWEREGLLSIQEFLVVYAKRIVRNSMDYVVHEISSLARQIVADQPSAVLVKDPIQRLSASLDLLGIDIFQHETRMFSRRFQWFVARGLPFLRWLSSLPHKTKLHAISHFQEQGRCKFTLFELLADQRGHWSAHDSAQGWSTGTQNVTCPNAAWTWADNRYLTEGKDSLRQRYNLRRSGYIFWEEERLRDEWRLPETYPHELKLHPRDRSDHDDDWHKERHLSIKVRFRGLPIPESIFNGDNDNSIWGRLMPHGKWKKFVKEGWPAPGSDEETKLIRFEY